MKIFYTILAVALAIGLLVPSGFLGSPLLAQCYDELAPNVKIPCGGFNEGPAGRMSLGGFVQQIIQIGLLVIGSISVLSLMIGGFRYVTAYGNEEALESAKQIIKYSILGLVIVLLSFVIVRIIANVLVIGAI